MKMIGFRCSSSDYTYAVIENSKGDTKIIDAKSIPFPKNYSHADILKWLYLEIERLLKDIKPSGIMIKRSEALASKGKPFITRVECEGIIFLLAGMLNIKYVAGKAKATILKDLGYKGKSKYFKTAVADVSFDEIPRLSDKIIEAVMVAKSGVKLCR